MKNIYISDSTLRLYQSVEGLRLSFKEKLETAKRLQELNVDCIELSNINGQMGDEVLIKTISTMLNKTTIACDAGTNVNDLEKNYALISSAKKKRLIITIPVSAVYMEYFVSKKPKAVIELLIELTKKATSLCNDVEVVLDDATRAEPSFLYLAISSAIEAGAKTITLTDIAGNMLPYDFYDFINNTKQQVVELQDISLLVQCSDAFSLATANSVSAIMAGANGAKVSALTLGCVPSIDKFFATMEATAFTTGYTCQLNKMVINRIVKQISSLTAVSSNILQNSTLQNEEDLTTNLSYADFSKLIKKRGYDLSSDDLKKIYNDYIKLSNKKSVSLKEIDLLIATTALSVPETYSLVNYSIHSSNVLNTTADIVLKKDEQLLKGLSYGNGSVEAAFFALEKIIGRHFELDDFELSSVTEGKEAVGQALIKLRFNGLLYSGRGISTDIIGASIKAYLNAVNKIVFEESHK